MPLDEEGAKWSCEPCIRGHRSSKCQHFDRLMMKVPKAGRPLAKCPHPKGTCSCQKVYAFMVRIPKGSTCLCRPLYQVPAPGSEPGKPPGKTSPKPSPPLSVAPLPIAPTPNRVQKRSKRQNSLQSNSEAVAKGLAALTEAPGKLKEGIANSETSYTDRRTPIAPSQCHVPIVPLEAYRRNPLPASLDKRHGPLSAPASRPYSSPALNFKQDSDSSAQPSTPLTPQCPAPCCSKSQSSQNNAIATNNPAVQNTVSTVAYTSNQETYPYTSFTQTPVTLQRSSSAAPKIETAGGLMRRDSNISAMSMADYSNPFALPGSTVPTPHLPQNLSGRPHFAQGLSSPATNYFPQNFLGFESHPGHNCGCGDTCQCLGCASHPFNDTTRQYIQEMGYMALGDADDNQAASPYSAHDFSASMETYNYQNTVFGQQQHKPHENIPDDLRQQPSPSLVNDTALPSPGVYGQHYEQLMQPAAYYTLEYPVGMPELSPCNNIMGTCQCGVNCSCTGCLTHHGHNGISLEPSPPPDRPSEGLLAATDTPIQYQAQSSLELRPGFFGLEDPDDQKRGQVGES